MRSVAITAVYARRVFMQWLTGWSWSLTLLANGVVATIIGLAIWSLALPGRADVVAYFASLLVVQRLTGTTAEHTFSGLIYDGGLTDSLLRPHSPVLAQIGWDLGVPAFDMLFTLPLIAAIALLTPAHVSLGGVALAAPAVVLAACVSFAFGFTLAMAAFWTQRYFAVADAGERLLFLLGGAAAPIPLLPPSLRGWVSALPFRSMRGFPAEIAAGMLDGPAIVRGYGLQVTWLVVLAGLSRLVWTAGIRRYTAVGG